MCHFGSVVREISDKDNKRESVYVFIYCRTTEGPSLSDPFLIGSRKPRKTVGENCCNA